MRRQFSRVTRLLLAATASVFALLLTFAVAVAVAEAGRSPFDLRLHHETTGPASTASIVFAVVVFAAIVCAAVAYLVHDLRRERLDQQAKVTHLPTDRDKRQTHKAA